MIPHQVWQGIDRLAFHENAILLDVKLRSQGVPIKTVVSTNDSSKADDGLSCQLIRCFLDDLALVLSGHGGKDNVAAVCMENDDEHNMIILRVARNDGVSEQKLSELDRLIQVPARNCSKGSLPHGSATIC